MKGAACPQRGRSLRNTCIVFSGTCRGPTPQSQRTATRVLHAGTGQALGPDVALLGVQGWCGVQRVVSGG